MTRKAKCCLVLIVLLLGVSLLPASDRTRMRAARRPESVSQKADPHEDRSVLVEAFVVQVDLAALYAMEVNPLGQAPHSVSVTNLLEALKAGEKASVLVGTKAVAVHKSSRNGTRKTETRYYPKKRLIDTPEGRKETVDHVAYENGQTLSVMPTIVSEDTVVLGYSFDYSGPRGEKRQEAVPLDTVSWSWEGNVSLNAGSPRIVGATQEAKTAVFLVLTAHILK